VGPVGDRHRLNAASLLRALLAAVIAVTGGHRPAAAAEVFAAAEPVFEAIGARQGLTSSWIQDVLVDRHGFVWMAGDSGVHRYDGLRVETFDRDPDRRDTLVSRANTALAETADAIWILSFAGVLQRLDAATGAIEHYRLERTPDGRQPSRGRRIVADRRGGLWIGTDIGLFRFDSASRRYSTVPLGGESRVTALSLSADGTRLLIGRLDGDLMAVDLEDPSRVEKLVSLVEGNRAVVPLVVAEANRQLWLGTSEGLFRFDLATRQLDRRNVPPTLTSGRIDALAIDAEGELWVSGQHRPGLLRFAPATGRAAAFRHHPDDEYSLTSDRVSALAMDRRGNLWVGLQQGGANRLRVAQQGAGRYRSAAGTSAGFCAARQLSDGRLLVALCGGSIGILDLHTGDLSERGGELDRALAVAAPTLTAHALVADGGGGWWVPTANLGLLHWQPQLGRTSRLPLRSHRGETLPDPFMNDALRDRQGRLWVACSLGLAVVQGDQTLRLLDPAGSPGGLLTGGVLALAESPDGGLWLGTAQGLVFYDPETGRTRRYVHDEQLEQSLSDGMVLSIHVAPSKTLWVGTQAGLNRATGSPLQGLRFRRYGPGDGLPDQTIQAMASDRQGTLWIGTKRGVASLDRGRDRFRTWTPADGLPDDSVNWRAALAASDGSVYFGTSSGLLRLLPDRLRTTGPQPLLLSGYELGGARRINLQGPTVPPLATPYTEARARFQIAAFGDHRRLSYRLAGLERRWQSMPPSLSLGYEALPPGSYRFEVRQLGTGGDWRAPDLAVPLTVLPPPWRTGGAYLGYGAGALAALVFLSAAYRRRRAQRRRHLAELQRLATYDVLTGLPNRTRFGEELAKAIGDGAIGEGRGAPLALLFIDLDRFKNINDSLGHRFGDLVLVAAAERLRAALPEAASLARLGGDEFTAILPGVVDEGQAAMVAGDLLAAFAAPMRVGGSDVVVTLSVGISLHPAHAHDGATLIQYADSAMYVAKDSGRNAYRFFAPEMVAQVSRRLALETSLRQALEHGELSLAFQPLIDLQSERLCGAEVLLRWHSPEHGAVSPAEFIPILEDTGMIEAVGLWLLEQVCLQVRAWRAAELPPIFLSVNVSVHQLIRGELCARMGHLLDALALPPAAFELEVTESVFMDNAERISVRLRELRALGIGIAIDDFGTGYSSFAALSRLPIDKLKIDKMFIEGVGSDENADTLFAAITAMAHNLRLTVVAEGVESELQHRRLRDMGCDQAQGYRYGRPVTSDELESLLRALAQRQSLA
jgi:diguanylate cyclase (GGDEF)-like protein